MGMTKSELLKNAKGILFSTPMVQAILEDRKKMTRRVIKPKNKNSKLIIEYGALVNCENLGNGTYHCTSLKPKYQIGDILYVKEAYAIQSGKIYYKADMSKNDADYINKWKPSIFMPKSAARIFLKVTNVRVERLQDISDDDAKAEGVEADPFFDSYINAFKYLWNSINGKRGYSWGINPFVWVYEFERIEVKE